MKSMIALALALLMLLSLTACGAKKEEQTGTESTESTELANPWSEAADPEEAARGAVLDRFVLPEVIDCTAFLPEQRSLSYMDGLAQAVYDNGADRMVIRKGAGSMDVSGDYNDYPESSELNFKGLVIRCAGADGQIRLVRWESDGNS